MLNNDDDNFNNSSRLVIHTLMANCFEQFKMKKIVVIHIKMEEHTLRDSSASFIINNRDENGKIQFYEVILACCAVHAEEVTELRNGLHYLTS